MKKKPLVLLIAVIPTLMPNLVFAVAIDVGDLYPIDQAIVCEAGRGCWGV
jgi:hypothetical protein